MDERRSFISFSNSNTAIYHFYKFTTTGGEITKGINTLYDTITQIIEDARASVYRTANFTMVKAYWHIGKAIVEKEQNGKERAEY